MTVSDYDLLGEDDIRGLTQPRDGGSIATKFLVQHAIDAGVPFPKPIFDVADIRLWRRKHMNEWLDQVVTETTTMILCGYERSERSERWWHDKLKRAHEARHGSVPVSGASEYRLYRIRDVLADKDFANPWPEDVATDSDRERILAARDDVGRFINSLSPVKQVRHIGDFAVTYDATVTVTADGRRHVALVPHSCDVRIQGMLVRLHPITSSQ